MTHQCPIAGCPHKLPSHILMCRPHWSLVPVSVKRWVYTSWNGGAAQNMQDYLSARAEAIRSVNLLLAQTDEIPEQIKNDMTLEELRQLRSDRDG